MNPATIDQIRLSLPPDFTIVDYLDQGGQGLVFVGTFKAEKVALKIFDPSKDLRRVERELTLLASIDSPYLAKLKATSSISISGVAAPLVAYEFLPGGDLRKLLDPSLAALTAESLATIGAHVGAATDTLWAHRIVHRDIKPANVVQANGDRFVLVDVGLARFLDRSNLTAVGHVAGTQGYMSPEQAAGRRSLTIHSDVFSLGTTLYELAARTHPFKRMQHLIGGYTPPSLKTLRGDLPEELTRFIDQMIVTVPSARPSSVTARFRQFLGA